MKWVPDSTGRFHWRPYYDQAELDSECERLVANFLRRKYGVIRFPLSTDDLSVMIEQEVSDLDLYADISVEGPDVEGLTEFFPDKKPAVRIARELSLDSSRSGRLRTTLAHEFGHVRFHTFLWDSRASSLSKVRQPGVLSQVPLQRKKYEQFRERLARRYALEKVLLSRNIPAQVRLSTGHKHDITVKCTRSLILDAPFSDWMEWQASYVCGAILMPISALRNCIRASLGEQGSGGWLPSDSDSARGLIVRVSEAFDVSTDAAKVRLEKLGFLQKTRLRPQA